MGAACGTGASSPDSCRAIEEALCRKASACNIPLEPPYSTNGGDVAACIRAYDVACLHGLDVGNPGSKAVDQCVAAIDATNDCAVVAMPQTDPACAWLVPAGSAADAAPAGDAGDAGDASVEASAASAD